MADFGYSATQLSPARGAGSEPIRGVVEAPSTYQFPSAALGIAGGVLGDMAKADQLAARNAPIAAYTREMTSLTQGFEQGIIKPEELSAKQSALGTKYAAMFAGKPELIEAFNSTRKSLLGLTSDGNAAEAVSRQDKLEQGYITQAIGMGYWIPANATREEREVTLKAAASVKQAEDVAARIARDNAERRAKNADERAMTSEQRAAAKFEQETRDAKNKIEAAQTLSNLASTNLEAVMEQPRIIRKRIQAGEISFEEGQALLNKSQTSISAQLLALSGTSPETARPWMQLFEDANKAGMSYIDPKTEASAVEAQYQTIKTKGMLVAIANPKVKGAVIASEMFKGTAVATLLSSAAVVDAVAYLSTSDGSPEASKAPQLVANGDKEVERNVYSVFKTSLKALQTGDVTNPAAAATQNKNAINNVLKQISKLLNDGDIRDTDFKEVSSFMASPEFAYAVKQGLLDPAAMQGAREAWQVHYQKSVVNGVRRALSAPVAADPAVNTFNVMGDSIPVGETPAKVTLADTVDLEFNGVGVRFVPNSRVSTTGRNASTYAAQQELSQTTTAVNQLIQIGAHLEGTTDYAKYWEENKYRILPDYYADPRNLKPGQVVNGYKFLGIPGATTRDKRNWEKAGG